MTTRAGTGFPTIDVHAAVAPVATTTSSATPMRTRDRTLLLDRTPLPVDA
jgi:hypothetical protein